MSTGSWSRKKQPMHSSEKDVQGPRPRRVSKQYKAIAGKGTWIRKAETKNCRDKAGEREPGDSNKSTKPGLLPGILNHHISTANILENSQC